MSNRNDSILIKYFRSKGVSIGENCHIYSSIVTPEPYLIKIGNNVTIAPGVRLITHDNSISKVFSQYTDAFGEISIEDNCFIGANSIILPGIVLGNNTIVAAGSVVTKSFQSGNGVIGGNPARFISSLEQYKNRIEPYGFNVSNMSYQDKKQIILSERNRMLKK